MASTYHLQVRRRLEVTAADIAHVVIINIVLLEFLSVREGDVASSADAMLLFKMIVQLTLGGKVEVIFVLTVLANVMVRRVVNVLLLGTRRYEDFVASRAVSMLR